jgi:plastocyanin
MTVSTKHATIAALGFAAALALGACGGGNGGDGGDATEQGRVAGDPGVSTPLRIEADEFSLSPEPLHAAPGTVAFEYVNVGAIEHTLVIEGVKDLKLEVLQQGDVDTGSVELAPGTYTVFCDIPGHRPAGMEAPLVVE